MADAYASYFAVHARGLSLNAKRVAAVQQTFYELGDCSFADLGHHGTPNQGSRASTWAADLGAGARPQGHILPAEPSPPCSMPNCRPSSAPTPDKSSPPPRKAGSSGVTSAGSASEDVPVTRSTDW